MNTSTALPTRLLLLLLLLLGQQSFAQSLDPAFHLPAIYRNTNVLDAIQQADGKWVVVGSFERVEHQPFKVSVVRYNTNGTLDQAFVQNASPLSGATKVKQLPNGQLLLLDAKWEQGSVQRTYLVRLNADGTLDPSLNMAVPSTQYPGYTAHFTALAVQADGKMLLTAHNASALASAERVMRLLPDGSRDTSFNIGAGPDESVMDVAVQADGRILLGGDFIFMNNTRVFGLVRLLSNGSLDSSFQPPILMPGGYFNDLTLEANGNLLVGYSRGSQTGPTSSTLFRLTPTGAPGPAIALASPYTNRSCRQVEALPNGQLMALFESYRDSANATVAAYGTQLVRLQPSGATDATLLQGRGPDGGINRIFCQSDGTVLLAGSFSNFNGLRRGGVALLQSTGSIAPGLSPQLHVQGAVSKAVRQPDGKLLLMGHFDAVEGQPADGVARLQANGQLDPAFSWRYPHGSACVLQALALQPDGSILVASNTFVWMNAPDVLLRYLPNGAPDPSFSAVFQGNRIYFLQVQPDGRIFVGGNIIDQAGKVGLTRLLGNGQVDASFVLPANEAYPSLLQPNGKLMAQVRRTSPATGYDLLRLLPSGAPDPSFVLSGTTPNLGSAALMLQQPSGQYVIASFFGTFGIPASPALAQIGANGTENTAFNSPVQAYHVGVPELGVYSMATQADGKVLVGGRVQLSTHALYDTRPLVRLQPDGQLDTSFDQDFLLQGGTAAPNAYFFKAYLEDVVVDPAGGIVVAGWFNRAGGQAATGLARLLPAGVLAVRAGRSVTTDAWPVPAHATLSLKLDAAARPWRVSLLDALGKAVLVQPTASAELQLNTEALARGFYVLRVDYANGPTTQRVVLE